MTEGFKLIDFPCSLCGANDASVVYESTYSGERLKPSDFNCTNLGHGTHFRIVQCNRCSMQYSSPRPKFEDLISAYSSSEDPTYVAEEGGRVRTVQRSFKRISKKSGTLFDIGCNTGIFLAEAKKQGFEVFGIEPSRFSAEKAKERGLNVIAGAVPGELPWKGPFDVITSWDVIEHVDDPLVFLKFAEANLAKGGELHLSTMDIGSIYAKICGHRWPWYMTMHLHYFTRKTMRDMLNRAGFSRVDFYQYSHVVRKDYLIKKIEQLSEPIKSIGYFGASFLVDNEGYVKVCMGDIMHVVAKRE